MGATRYFHDECWDCEFYTPRQDQRVSWMGSGVYGTCSARSTRTKMPHIRRLVGYTWRKCVSFKEEK